MNGSIQSDQRCPICGERYRDNFRDGLQCPDHPEQRASRFRVYFKDVSKRFKGYNEAQRFLTGLRYETDRGTFDHREYKSDAPLSFRNLAEQWLTIKQGEVQPKSFVCIRDHINKASSFWQDKSIKHFKKRDFQLFLNHINHLSSKTRHNHLSTIHQFFNWLWENEDIEKLPKFPEAKFELALRKTVLKETQKAIIDEVWKISHKINPKIWLGVKFLATYFNVRPGELRNILEKDIDLQQRTILIPHPKERTPKFIFLIDEDVELLRSFPRGFPNLFFFRHQSGKGGVRPGQRFGPKYLQKFWNRACKNLGIQGVTLYAGTRHSTVSDLRQHFSPEQIKLASGHHTSKAFMRYFQIDGDDLRKTYSVAANKGVAMGWQEI